MNYMNIYIGKIKTLFLFFLLSFPSFLSAQQYQAEILHRYIYSKTGDTLELTLKYYSLGGSANLGFSNFSVGITPLGVADFLNASVIYPGNYSGVYYWEQTPDYDSLNLGGTNFINVTVVPTLCGTCSGLSITNPSYDSTVAIVKIPLNSTYCGDSVKIFWRIDPDGLGGGGVILDYSGNDLKSFTAYSDTIRTKMCYDFPPTPPTISASNTTPCVGDTIVAKLNYPADYLWDSVFFYANNTLIAASASDSFLLPIINDDTIKIFAITSFHCDCANDTSDTLIIVPHKQLKLLQPLSGFYQVCESAQTDTIKVSNPESIFINANVYGGTPSSLLGALGIISNYVYTTSVTEDTVLISFVSNVCPNDSVSVTVYVSDSAKGSLTTPKDTLCIGNTITLDANVISGQGVKWFDPSGGVFTPSNTSPTADYTPSVLTNTVITISYLISGSACPDTLLNKQLVIKEAPAFIFPPITPDTICAGAATNPLGVTILAGSGGFWSCANCSGYFSDTTNPNAQYVSVPADGGKNLDLVWNMAAPACDTVRDTQRVHIVSASGIGNFNQTLPNICVGDTSVLIAATLPTNPNFGYYWETSGNGQFLDATKTPCPSSCSSNPVYYVSVPADAGDTITITYLVYDITFTCDTTRFIEYLIINDSARGYALPDTSVICFPGSSDTLRGTFLSGLTKYWSENGAGAFDYVNDSTVVYLPTVSDQNNTIDAVWNIESGACPPHRDTTKVIVSTPPVANITYLGSNTNLCQGSTSDTLIGSAPPPGGTGRWETPDGLGTFSNPTGDTTTYTASASDPASVTIYWIVENRGCTPDTAVFTFNITAASSVSGTFDLATKGRDTICVSNDFSLVATVSGANANPHWECSGCSGSFNPNITTIPGASYSPSVVDPDSITIRLVIEDNSGACTPLILEGILYIGKQPQGKPIYVPPQSDSLCVGDTIYTLVGDTIFGTGYWSCIGCNGVFSAPTNDTTNYYSVPADAVNDTTVLQILWITQLPPSEPIQVCPADTQIANIPIFKIPVGNFVLGPNNDTICVGDTTAPLGATSSIGAGHWECPNCDGGLTFNFTGNSSYIPVISDSSKQLQLTWVTENGICPADRDTSLLYVSPPPSGNLAGLVPNPVCIGTPVPLQGNVQSGQGFWWVLNTNSGSSPPYCAPYNVPNSCFIPDSALPYLIIFNITSPGCDTLQYFQYTVAQDTPYADLTRLPDTACAGGDILLTGVLDIYGTLDTFIVSPPGTLTQDNKGNDYISSTTADLGSTIYLSVVVSNAVCGQDTFVDSVYLGTSPFTLAFRDTSICKGDQIVLQASGAVTYSWTPKNALYIQNPNSATPTVFPPVSTVFRVTMRNDTLGCVQTDSVNVTVNPLPTVSISPGDTTICAGDTLLLTASGAHTYEWQGNQWFSDTFSTQTYVSTRTATIYKVEGTDTITGCKDIARRLINTVPAPTIFFDIRDMCTGQSVVVSAQQDTGCVNKYWFNAPYNVVRNIPPPYTNSPYFITSQDTFTFNATTVGTFPYTVLCTSSNNCKAIYQDTVKVYPQPVADFSAIPTEVSLLNPKVQFTNLSTGATQFLWNFGDINSGALNTDTARNPVHVFADAGSFTVALSVTNEIGCTDLEIKPAYISVIGEQYYFPTAFTPNGDGKNDLFRPLPLSSDPNIVSFEIYDRWGKLIFQTTSRNGWDGNDAKGRPFAPGAYSYKCIIELSNKQRQVYTGRVTLIR